MVGTEGRELISSADHDQVMKDILDQLIKKMSWKTSIVTVEKFAIQKAVDKFHRHSVLSGIVRKRHKTKEQEWSWLRQKTAKAAKIMPALLVTELTSFVVDPVTGPGWLIMARQLGAAWKISFSCLGLSPKVGNWGQKIDLKPNGWVGTEPTVKCS